MNNLPNLSLEVYNGETPSVSLPEDFLNKKTLLFFYPKDDTPGCTKQSIEFTSKIGEFKNLGVQVFGVSGDDLNSHHQFSEKYDLKIPLLCDANFALSKHFGLYGDHEVKGFKYTGISRDIIFIDESGSILFHFEKVNPVESVEIALGAIKDKS